jgi:4-cresol dehydrogenase (hydroxylating)
VIDSNVIVQQLRKIVGGAHAAPFLDAEMAAYRSLLDETAADTPQPIAVVTPAKVEEIQAILTAAGKSGLSVVSMANASGNGSGSTLREKPVVLLDLSRLDKIIEVNTDSGYALLEPGVSFDQLREYLTTNETGYWIDCDANGAHSVCASITERSFGHTPYGDHLLMQCGMEVVLGNGEILRTGMGALPNSDTWQLFKYNYGPYLDGLFSQSELAVVTKVGLWLMPAPPKYLPFMVSLPDTQSVDQALEVLRPLKIQMVIPNTVTISHRSADAALLAEAGLAEQAGTVAKSTELHDWNLFGALYGVPDNVDITWEMVSSALRSIPGATLFGATNSPSHPVWPLRERLMRGAPAYSSSSAAGQKTLWFSVASPIEGEAGLSMLAALEKILAPSGIEFEYEFSLSWRTLFMRVSAVFSKENFSARQALFLTLINELDSLGFGVSHESRDLTRAVSSSQTSAPMNGLTAKISAALDPLATLR